MRLFKWCIQKGVSFLTPMRLVLKKGILIVAALSMLCMVANATVTEIGTHVKEGHTVRTIIIDETIRDTDYREFLLATKGEFIILYIKINTSGGQVDPTLAMLNEIKALKDDGVWVITDVRAVALSAGAILFMAGDERIMHPGGVLMFHHAKLYTHTYPPEEVVCPNEDYKYLCDSVVNTNKIARQMLLNILRDTELVNRIYSPKQNNYIYAEEAFELGLATKYK